MIVYGKNVFKETINSDKKINQIYLSNSFDDKDILEDIANNLIDVANNNGGKDNISVILVEPDSKEVKSC